MISTCWCGSETLGDFGPDYRRCLSCHTLIYAHDFNPQEFEVKDDETDFYGKNYWMKHQQESFGYSDFETRSRADLTERNLHWLKSLLKLKVPPGKVLELGCAHGSFVALLKQCGFDAIGLEMSPWVVDYGRRTFDIEVLEGPIEKQAILEGTLDAILLMDVIEHLPDPSATMAHCLSLLKPEGILLIQTPDYRPEMVYEDLLSEKAAFLEQLKPREHLYLFSPASITEFFSRLGADYLHFFPAIFEQYDMFFAVSKTPFDFRTEDEIQRALELSRDSRMVRALLDVYEQSMGYVVKLEASEDDREARLKQIDALTGELKVSERDRDERIAQIRSLTEDLEASEADRVARFEQIRSLTGELEASEADRAARFDQIQTLTEQLGASELDRQARFDQIQTLTEIVKTLQGDQEFLRGQLEAVSKEVLKLISRSQVRRLSKLAGFDEVERLAALMGKPHD